MKVLKESTHPNHKLIKALKEKGHTNIEVRVRSSMEGRRGVYVLSDQEKYLYLAAEINTAIVKLEKP
jgi:hypothetical protein